ncbi:MAG: MGMT family protein [Woeseiaceae bacterium]
MSTEAREKRRAAVHDVVSRIPRGCVCSYGKVATLAGLANGAREVGRFMGQLPAGSDLPWHRVLNAQGRIHNAADSPAGRRQVERLQVEGVLVSNGKVNMKSFGWNESLDALLWSNPDDWGHEG